MTSLLFLSATSCRAYVGNTRFGAHLVGLLLASWPPWPPWSPFFRSLSVGSTAYPKPKPNARPRNVTEKTSAVIRQRCENKNTSLDERAISLTTIMQAEQNSTQASRSPASGPSLILSFPVRQQYRADSIGSFSALSKMPQYTSRDVGDPSQIKKNKQSMADLKLRRLTELNSRLREDLERERIPVSQAAKR